MKLKRSDVYIIANRGDGKTAYKKKGYIFQKNGHWFTIRHKETDFDSNTNIRKKWIVSDLVTGVVMTQTDNKLEDVPDALSDAFVDKLMELYKDNSTSFYWSESSREQFQKYVQMINEAMFNDKQDRLIGLLQDSARELFN